MAEDIKAPLGDEPETSNAAKSRARLAAVQALYQVTATNTAPEGVIREFLEMRLSAGAGAKPRIGVSHEPEELALAGEAVDTALFTKIVRAAIVRKDDVEAVLKGALEPQWTLARLEWPLQALLRAGVAELLATADVPPAIIINDYMNVAHAFFGGKEPGLVNGVLDRIAKSVRS